MNFPKLFLALLFLGFTSCSQKNTGLTDHRQQPLSPTSPPLKDELENGIVNGQIPKDYELAYKYTVAIRNYDDKSLCTGAIVGPRLIVTAAHCVKTAKGTVVYFGANIKKPVDAIQAVKIVIPKQYRPFRENINAKAKDIADVAAIVIARDIPKTHRVARFMEPEQKLREGDRLMVVGFGTTGGQLKDSGTLRKTNINVLDPSGVAPSLF